jgi:hypothetical protein
MWLLCRCNSKTQRLQSQPLTLSENDLSNLTLEKIEQELQLMNVNLAEANDIAMLSAFASMPADLDNESRSALRRLRDKMMERARARADI